jgi:hypothetical protein
MRLISKIKNNSKLSKQVKALYNMNKKAPDFSSASIFCTLDGIRTHDPQLRRLLLYPTELPRQFYLISL